MVFAVELAYNISPIIVPEALFNDTVELGGNAALLPAVFVMYDFCLSNIDFAFTVDAELTV